MRSNEIRTKEKSALDPEDRAILEAMEEVSGYLDITPEDFLDILHRLQDKGELTRGSARPPAPAPKLEAAPAQAPAPAATVAEPSLPWLTRYLNKLKPSSVAPRIVSLNEMAWSWVGSFLGILAVAYINFVLLSESDMVMLIGSFGASAVFIYGAIKSPLAQPRNFVGGHIVSGLVGSATYILMPSPIYLTGALAVSLAIVAMHRTGTLHPPGGATALIAVIGSEKIHNLGLLYAFIPAGLGALVMLVVAVLVNNLATNRKYPEYWY